MTAAALKALAERVEAHSLDEFGACRCGWQAEDEEDPFPEWSMHVAAVLAPLVAGEVALAVEEAAQRVERALVEAREADRFAMQDDGNGPWRRGCQAGLDHAVGIVRGGQR